MEKIVIFFAVLSAGIISHDTGIIFSSINSGINLTNNKVEYNNSIKNYDTFKKNITEVPYSDEDFKRDLISFEYKYGYKGGDNPILEEVLFGKDAKFSGDGVLLGSIFYNNTILTSQNEYYNDISNYIINNEKKYLENNKEFYEDINKLYYEKITTKKYDYDTKLFYRESKINLIAYTTINPYKEINSIANNNLSRLLKEKGFGPNLIYLSNADMIEYNSEYDENNNEKRINVIKKNNSNNEELRKYYENGNLDKLREIFKIGNGFSKLMVYDYVNKMGDSSNMSMPFIPYMYYSLTIKDNLDIMNMKKLAPSLMYENFTGRMTKEKQDIYNEGFINIIYRNDVK